MDQIIHLGDATVLEAYALPDGSVDLILCDPPFPPKEIHDDAYTQIRPKTKAKLASITTPSVEEYPQFWESCLRIWVRKLKPTGWLCFKMDDEGSKILYPMTSKYFKFRRDVIWDKVEISLGTDIRSAHEIVDVYRMRTAEKAYFLYKEKTTLGRPSGWHGGSKGKAFSSVIHLHRPQNGKYGEQGKTQHINETPPAFWYKFVRFMCPPKGLVLDPFAGSGSVGMACRNLNRQYYGIEIDPDYVQLAQTRIGNIMQRNLDAILTDGGK